MNLIWAVAWNKQILFWFYFYFLYFKGSIGMSFIKISSMVWFLYKNNYWEFSARSSNNIKKIRSHKKCRRKGKIGLTYYRLDSATGPDVTWSFQKKSFEFKKCWTSPIQSFPSNPNPIPKIGKTPIEVFTSKHSGCHEAKILMTKWPIIIVRLFTWPHTLKAKCSRY